MSSKPITGSPGLRVAITPIARTVATSQSSPDRASGSVPSGSPALGPARNRSTGTPRTSQPTRATSSSRNRPAPNPPSATSTRATARATDPRPSPVAASDDSIRGVYEAPPAASAPEAAGGPGDRSPSDRPTRVVGRTWAMSSGKARTTAATPTRTSSPPETTANCGAGDRRDGGRLDVAEPRAAGHDEHVDRRDPAAQLIRRGELDDRRAEDRRQHVGRAGDRQQSERERERERRQSEPGDGQAPDDDGPDHRSTRGSTRRTQPDRTAPRNAPTPGAAAIRPTPAGPTPKTSRASAGKSDVGIPKIIATRSIAKVDRMTRRRAANRRPSRIAVRPGRTTAAERRRSARSRQGQRATPRTTGRRPRRRRPARPSR